MPEFGSEIKIQNIKKLRSPNRRTYNDPKVEIKIVALCSAIEINPAFFTKPTSSHQRIGKKNE
jgi:hypothetical protein